MHLLPRHLPQLQHSVVLHCITNEHAALTDFACMLTTGCQTWLAHTYLTTRPKALSPPQSTIDSIAAATAAVTMGTLHHGVFPLASWGCWGAGQRSAPSAGGPSSMPTLDRTSSSLDEASKPAGNGQLHTLDFSM